MWLVIPAYNELDVIAQTLLRLPTGIFSHTIVADNGSTDNTSIEARRAGATVIQTTEKGYGAACLAALAQAPDDAILVFLQADGSEDASEATQLIEPILNNTADLVIGSRVLGKAQQGAIRPHQRFGNWLSTRLIGLFWGQHLSDLGPFRAIRASTLKKLNLKDRNYGWIVEMHIRSAQQKLRVLELPVSSGLRQAGTEKVSGNPIASLKAGAKMLATIFKIAARDFDHLSSLILGYPLSWFLMAAIIFLFWYPLSSGPLHAQTPITTSSSEVLIDLVVRDKRGRPIRNLSPFDISITADGKPYDLKSLRWVNPTISQPTPSQPATEASSKPTPTQSAPDPLQELRFVTLLFEPLPRESARLAQETALALLDKAASPNTFFSILLAREKLKLVQNYTNDPIDLKKAIRAVTSMAGYKEADDLTTIAERQLRNLASNGEEFDRFLRGEIPKPPGINLSAQAPNAADLVRAKQAEIALNMPGMSDSFQRQHSGRVSLNSLRAAIRSVASLPGRKPSSMSVAVSAATPASTLPFSPSSKPPMPPASPSTGSMPPASNKPNAPAKPPICSPAPLRPAPQTSITRATAP